MHQEIWFQKYKILGLLGRGGTARVYLAEHIILNSYRAIKVISKNNPFYDLQRNEAFILKNLRHSCIPIIYDIEENEEGSYIVEQYLEGETLRDYVEARGSCSDDIIIKFGLQICDLIHYLHSIERPVLYLDLKPENIIISGDEIKLIDFGSAMYQDELTDQHKYMGTLGYAAPELFRKGRIDERCDVYGIGMLFYYMATGCHITRGRTELQPIEEIGGCSAQLQHMISKCLRYHPYQRYATVAGLYKQLSALLKKDQSQKQRKEVMVIAVAGALDRIGVTHFAFRLCRYYDKTNRRYLYEERNASECVCRMKRCYDGTSGHDGVCELKGIPMLSYQQRVQHDYRSYPILIRDYGVLSEDNLTDFLSCDKRILILGAKDWELEQSEKVLRLIKEQNDVCYLFNYMDGRQFRYAMKHMNHRIGYRIPYEPDPFAEISLRERSELFDELFQPERNHSFFEKAVKWLKSPAV